jgi:tetratricopeptide (TPR) repeat protein
MDTGSGPPYPGLRPFRRSESYLFFGRDDCTNAMVSRLAETHFLAVLGASGSGKSSLVNTGLIESLELGFMAEAGSRWRIAGFRPEDAPLRNLAHALLATEDHTSRQDLSQPDGEIEVTRLRARLKNERAAVIAWCREGHLPEGTSLLILVDQFEELFRYQSYAERDEAEDFVAQLIEIKKASDSARKEGRGLPIYVTITMRSEFLGACSLIPELAEAINEGAFLTPRMTRAQCELAITGPAQVCGVSIEDALVNKVLNDMADLAAWDEGPADQERGQAAISDRLSILARRADQLPLMQHALNQLWSEATKSNKGGQTSDEHMLLTVAGYTEIGGLSGALDRHADAIFNDLGPEHQPVAETVFRALTGGRTVADAVRWPTTVSDLVKISGADNAKVEKVVNAFRASGCNFVLPEIEQRPQLEDTTTIDISHESLIRQWKRLSGWLEKEADAAQAWRRLVDLAHTKGFVLRGLALTNGVELFNAIKKKPAWAERYGNSFGDVQRLVRNSRARRRRGWATAAAVTAALIVPYTVLVSFYRLSLANYRLAMTSSQKLLDQIGNSFNDGSITVKGAKKLLRTADSIVDQVAEPGKTWEILGLQLKLPVLSAQPLEVAGLRINTMLMQYDVRYTIGEYDLAYKIGQSARALLQALPKSEQQDPKGLLLAYSVSWRMADALADQGNDPETLQRGFEEFAYAEGIARKLAQMEPENGWRQRNIMFVLQKVGDIYQVEENPDSAIAKYYAALEIAKQLVARPSPDPIWMRDLANCYSRLGQAFALKRDFENALKNLNTALDIRTELWKPNKEDAVALSNLGRSHVDIGKVYEQQSQLEGALGEYRIAEGIRSNLVKKDPTNDGRLSQLAIVQMYIGKVLKKLGEQRQDDNDRKRDWNDALAEFNQALNIRQNLVVGDTENQDWQGALATTRLTLGELLELDKRLDEALQQYSYAVETLDDLTDNRPKKAAEYREKAFEGRTRMAGIEGAQGKNDQALEDYRKALAIAQQLATQNESNASWQGKLASAHEKVGDELLVKRDWNGALDEYKAALAIVKKLLEGSDNPEWIRTLDELQAKIKALPAKD